MESRQGERRASGSYSPPAHIVDYIIDNTLRPLCRAVADRLHEEVDAARQAGRTQEAERLERDFAPRVLALRVLDPSMGSGHFLLRACQYLAEEIATNPYTPEPPGAAGGEGAIAYWK